MGGDEIAKPECVIEGPWRSHEQGRVEAKHIALTTRACGRKRSVDTTHTHTSNSERFIELRNWKLITRK
jgi:hypothetical protein